MINKLASIFFIFMMMNDSDKIIFDFSKDSNLSSWRILDDVVMGGESRGSFYIDNSGNGIFSGRVSLDNNGGFSSLRYRFNKIEVKEFTSIVLRVKGDGKNYQFRIKKNASDYYSFIKTFSTTSDWEDIKINISEMYPTFRGRRLNMDNFSGTTIEEIALLIGNKRNESFKIEIDKIYLK